MKFKGANLKKVNVTPSDNPVANSIYEWPTIVADDLKINYRLSDGSEKSFSVGVTGTSIKSLVFTIPMMTDDSALHFALEVFTTVDYTGTATESFNTASSQTNVKVFDGTALVAFPAEGVGTPYYSEKLSVALQTVVAGTNYYIRYKFFVVGSTPSETPWYLTQYPVLEINNKEERAVVTGSTRYAKGNITGAVAIDFLNGDFQVCTTTGTVTGITISNLPSEMGMVLRVNNAGAYAVTYNGTEIVATTDTGDYACSFYNDDGTVYFMGKGRMY